MRRFPISWSDTLAKLGYRRRFKKTPNRCDYRSRRPQFEALEERAMLSGNTYTVTTLSDTGGAGVSLRQALVQAANDGSTSVTYTINFDSNLFSSGPATIELGPSGQLLLNSNVTIQGPGADKLSISGKNLSRVFQENAGVTATISGVTLTGGGNVADGGGIYVSGTLILDSVHVDGNAASSFGGAIYVYDTGTLSLSNSTLDHNQAGSATAWAEGGGIFIRGGGGQHLTVTGSTISNNTATGIGGAISFQDVASSGTAAAAISNSTISDNAAGYSGAIRARGARASLTVNNSTIADNRGSESGGVEVSDGATAALSNTIVADNHDPTGTDSNVRVWGSGSVTGSFDMLGANSLDLTGGNNITLSSGEDARLAPLANNGGPTKTRALLPGSRAIDAGSYGLSIIAAAVTDQRGFDRFIAQDGNSTSKVDIGAYELGLVVTDSSDVAHTTYSAEHLTLRDAIARAKSLSGKDQITFSADVVAAGEIRLTNGQLEIQGGNNIEIAGPGADLLTINAHRSSRIFKVYGNVDATISGLALINGSADYGGAIKIETGASAHLEGIIAENNYASVTGGAIDFRGTQLDILDSTLQDNSALGGGGINALVTDGNHLTIERSEIINNHAFDTPATAFDGNGGGIFIQMPTAASGASQGVASIVDTTIDSNIADIWGGGMYIYGGTVNILRSAITRNRAVSVIPSVVVGHGGGIVTYVDPTSHPVLLSIADSTIAANVAEDGGGLAFEAAGLDPIIRDNFGSLITLTNSTVATNQAQIATRLDGSVDGGFGGGIANFYNYPVLLQNTIVATNGSNRDPLWEDVYGHLDGTLASPSTHNIVGIGNSTTNLANSPGGGSFNQIGSAANLVEPHLSTLGNYGGLTETLVALPGSSAIDAGSDSIAAGAGLTIDQRGYGRRIDTTQSPNGVDGTVDIGAAETGEIVASKADFNGDGRDDFATLDRVTGRIIVFLGSVSGVDGSVWGTLDPSAAWDGFQIGDFNGDGRDDLVARKTVGSSKRFTFAISEGNHFQVLAAADSNLVVYPLSWTEFYVGDFDGDKSDELLGWNSTAADWEALHYSEHAGFTLDAGSTNWGNALTRNTLTTPITVGDVNRDGRDDLVARASTSVSSAWLVALSQPNVSGRNQVVQTNFDGWFNNSTTDAAQLLVDVDKPYDKFLEIYSKVYNNVELEVYPGLMKGIKATEQTARGNDWDQAALLVDRLDTAGFSAQIAEGNVDVSAATARAWLGVTSNGAAFQLLLTMDDNADAFNSGGSSLVRNSGHNLLLPFNAATVNNGQASVFRFRHAWVKVNVPTANGFVTVDVDPSWKYKDRQPGIAVDLSSNGSPVLGSRGTFDEFDYLSGSDAILSGDAPAQAKELPVEVYEDQVAKFLLGQNKSLADVPYDGPIIQQLFKQIPIELADGVTANSGTVYFDSPSQIISTSASAFTHRATVKIFKDGGGSASADFVIPASSLDPIYIDFTQSASTYTPRLWVNGTVQSFSGAVSFSATDDVKLQITHHGPTDLWKSVDDPSPKTYTRKPGQIMAIGFDADQYSSQRIIELQANMNALLANGADVTDIGSFLAYAGTKYWYEFNSDNRIIDGLMRAVGATQWVGSGIMTSDAVFLTQPNTHLDFPIVPKNMGIDLPNVNHVSFNIATGDDSDEAFQLSSFNSSALESAIVEETIDSKSISTVRGLQDAYSASNSWVWVYESVWDNASSSRKVYRRGAIGTYASSSSVPYSPARTDLISSFPISADLNGQTIAADITTLLQNTDMQHGGFDNQQTIRVLVPNRKSVVGDWSGSVYVAEYKTPKGDAGEYIIAQDGTTPTHGGFSGNQVAAPNLSLPPGPFSQANQFGDPVSPANGNMSREETDFTFANVGAPLDLKRTYNSQLKLNVDLPQRPLIDVGFGPGWTHSFSDRLYVANSAGAYDVTWVTSTGEQHRFTNTGGTVFTSPHELFGKLELLNNYSLFRYSDPNGTIYEFTANAPDLIGPGKLQARLSKVLDRDGNGIQITYVGSMGASAYQIATVEDIHDANRKLVFTYDGQNIGSVLRSADLPVFYAALWQYGYQPISSTNYLISATAPPPLIVGAQGPRTTYDYFGPSDALSANTVGLMKQVTEPNGDSHRYEYYANGRVFRVTDGLGHTQTYNYNLYRNLAQITDERGNVETDIYREDGMLERQIHPDRSRLSYEWGAQDSGDEFLMTESTDEVGAIEQYTYYETADHQPGQLKDSTNKDRITTHYDYWQSSTPAYQYISELAQQTIDPGTGSHQNLVTQYVRDAASNGHLLRQIDPLGNTTQFAYYSSPTDPPYLNGLVKSKTEPNGLNPATAATWEILTDSFIITGDTLSVRLAAGTTSGRTLDADAIRIDRLDEDAEYTRIVDDLDTDFHVAQSGASTITAGYKSHGTILASQPGSSSNSATWIFRDLLPGEYRISATWVADASSRESQANYQLFDGLPTSTPDRTAFPFQTIAPNDFTSFKTVYHYDSAGNVTSAVTEGLPPTERFNDTFGNVNANTDPTGAETLNQYDALGRLVTLRTVASQSITFDSADVQSYGGGYGWDATPTNWSVQDRGSTLKLFGNTRKAVAANYTVTPNTVLEFDLDAPSQQYADYFGIAFGNSLVQVPTKEYKLGGTDATYYSSVDYTLPQYVVGSGPKHYSISLKSLPGNAAYIFFIDAHTLSPAGNYGAVSFSNVRLYESASGVATTAFNYDPSGQLTSSTDALGHKTTNVYDHTGRLTSQIFADGASVGYEYDEAGNRISSTDELGRKTQFIYDDRNRLVQTVFADGSSTRTRYDGAGRVVASFDELGHETDYAYDVSGRLLSTKSTAAPSDLIQTANKYDGLGRRVESVDGNGNVTVYRNDALGRVVQTTVLDKTYNSPNNLSPIWPPVTLDPTKAPVFVSTIEYDANGNVARTAVYDSASLTEGNNPTDYSRLLNHADSYISTINAYFNRVHAVTTSYDAFGRPVTVTNADGTTTSTIYDAAGRVRYSIDELGRKTENVYDAFGRLDRTISPPVQDASSTSISGYIRYVRDAAGNIVETRQSATNNVGAEAPAELVATSIYDARGRLVTTIRPDGARVDSVYDAAGELVASVDAMGSASYLKRDERGRVVLEHSVDPDGTPKSDGSGKGFAAVTSHQYDSVGNLKATTDALGNTTNYAYDAQNRLITESHNETLIADDSTQGVVVGGDSAFVASGDTILASSNPAGAYDGDRTIIQSTSGTGTQQAAWTFSHLEAGDYRISLSSVMVSSSTSTATVEILGLNPSLVTVISHLKPTPDFRTVEGDHEIGWDVLTDNDGHVVSVTVAQGQSLQIRLSLTGNGTIVADAVRLDRLVSTGYTYDDNGNKLTETDTRLNKTIYTYDELNRKTQVNSPDPDGAISNTLSPLITAYSYDGYGNLTTTEEWRGKNKPAPGATPPSPTDANSWYNTARISTFQYDLRNRLTAKVVDAPTSPQYDTRTHVNATTTYKYDAVGNKTDVTDPVGATTRYRYDNLNRVIDQYDDYQNGQTAVIALNNRTSYQGSVTIAADQHSATFTGSSEAYIDIGSHSITSQTILEFDLQTTNPAEAYLVGLDTNDSAEDPNDYSGDPHGFGRYFDLGGPAGGWGLADFRQESFAGGPIHLSIPVGEYLAASEQATGVTVNRLYFSNYDSRTGLLDPSSTTFSNVRIYDSDEVRTVTTYDAYGNVATVQTKSDPRSIQSLFKYDQLGRQTDEYLDYGGPQERHTSTIYDANGNVLIERAPAPNSLPGSAATVDTVHQYDKLNRLISTTLPDADGNAATANGLVTKYAYDAAGRQVSRTNGELETTTTDYDNLGNVVAVTDGNHHQTRYQYDSEGNQTVVTDPDQNTTTYTYDPLNRETAETVMLPDSGGTLHPSTRTTVYDAKGNVKTITDRDLLPGSTTAYRTRQFFYDTLDRRTEEKWVLSNNQAVSAFAWQYDNLGRVTYERSGTSGLGGQTAALATALGIATPVINTFTYDKLGRLSSQANHDYIGSPGYTTSSTDVDQYFDYRFAYADGAFHDQVVRGEYGGGVALTPIGQTISEYDRLGELSKVDDRGIGPWTDVTSKSVSFGYDAAGNLSQIGRAASGGVNLGSTYQYDNSSRLTQINHQSSTAITHGYAYDNASRIAEFDTTAGSATTGARGYVYDDAGQLTDQIAGFDRAQYEYDANGNRIIRGSYNYTSPSNAIGSNNRLLADDNFSYQYDAEGNLTQKTETFSGKVTTYTWDYRNRLVQVTDKSGSTVTQQTSYTYDAEGHRVKRINDPDGQATAQPAVTQSFVYDGDELALQFGGELHRYLYGPAVDQVLADEATDGSGTPGDVFWLLGDHENSVRDVVDSGGTLRQHVDYDPFGNPTGNANNFSAIDELFGYTGREFDQATGLENNHARWYSPDMGRFISEDPGGVTGDVHPNPFEYAGNDPVDNTDPTGRTIKLPTFNLPSFTTTPTLPSFSTTFPTPTFSIPTFSPSVSYASPSFNLSGGTSFIPSTKDLFGGGNLPSYDAYQQIANASFASQVQTANNQIARKSAIVATNLELASTERDWNLGSAFFNSVPDPVVAYANSPRAQAVGQLVGVGFEGAASAGFALAPDPTLLTKGAAGYLAYRAFDNAQAGIRQLVTGRPTDTLTKAAVSGGLSYVGVDPQLAGQIGGGVNFAADIASVGLSLAAPKLQLPSVRTNAELVQDIAIRAEAKIGGTGRFAGTDKHVYAKELLDRYQSIFGQRGLQTEVSIIGRERVPYGTSGSVRLDVLEGNVANPTAIYDYKFGVSGLSTGRINQIQTVTGYGQSVPIFPVHP